MDPTTDWELSKENFQPLRSGRKASALQQRGQKELNDEKQTFEMKLRTYDGADPLEPWHNYITWTEQNFPKGGKDANLHTLLEKCIQQFKNDTKNCQDIRYLDVWVKYASMAQTPLDIYSFMHEHAQCTTLPEFYVSWSWELEQVGKYKDAERNYRVALDLLNNDPNHPKYEGVETKHRQFQARVMKRMVEGGAQEAGAESESTEGGEQRTALGSLRGHGKANRVGAMRVGSAKKSDRPGVLSTLPASSRSGQQNSENPGFQIYQDGENSEEPEHFVPGGGGGKKIDSKNLPFRKNTDRENDPSADKWTKSNVGNKKHSVPLDKIRAAPSFAVHQDTDVQQPTTTPHKLKPGERGNVLTAKRPAKDDGPEVPLALFEPFDPTKKAMYAKQLVYQGTTELSFEELRAARYWKKVEEAEMKQKQEDLEKMMSELKAERDRMAKEQEEWRLKQQAEMQLQKEEMMRWQKEEMMKMMAEQLRQQQQISNTNSSCGSQPNNSSSSQQHSQTSKQLQQQQQPQTTLSREGSVSQKSSSLLLETTAALLQTNPLGTSSTAGENSSHKTPPRSEQQVPQPKREKSWPNPSPTVNTKEAYNIAQAMWGCSVQKEAIPPTASRKRNVAPKPFDVYADQQHESDQETSNGNDAGAPFAVFQDDEPTGKPPHHAQFAVFQDEVTSKPAPIFSSTMAVFQDEPTNKAAPFPVFQDEATSDKAGAPFAVFQDEESKPSVNKAEEAPFQIYVDENNEQSDSKFAQPVQQVVKSQDDENLRPQEAATAKQQTLVSEVGQPQRSSVEPGSVAPTFAEEQTMKVPSMEAFAQMAQAVSTPFHGGSGRRFEPEEDENTCAVHIAFKKPLLPPRISGISALPEREETSIREASRGQVVAGAANNEEASKSENKAGQVPDAEVVDINPVADDVEEEDINGDVSFVPQQQQIPMSPIMETSREHNYRSSSSSESSQSQWGLTHGGGHSTAGAGHFTLGSKSHWANNTEGPNKSSATTAVTTSSVLASRTPGSSLSKSLAKSSTVSGTELSGYAADASSARTPGEFLKKAMASGHKVSSNNTTAGGNVSGVTRPLSQSPATVSKQNKSKRTKINPLHFVAEDDEDDVNDEMTGMFDMMSDFKRNAGIISPAPPTPAPAEAGEGQTSDVGPAKFLSAHQLTAHSFMAEDSPTSNALKNSYVQQKLKASYLETPGGVRMKNRHDMSGMNAPGQPNLDVSCGLATPVGPSRSCLDVSAAPPSFLEASKSDMKTAPTSSGSGPSLDLTAAPPSLDLTAAPPSLDLTAAPPSLDLTAAPPSLEHTTSHEPDEPFEQPSSASMMPSIHVTPTKTLSPDLPLGGPELDISRQLGSFSLDDLGSPFSCELHERLLQGMTAFPVEKRHGYHSLTAKLPTVRTGQPVGIGPYEFIVTECKGEGAYGKVFSAVKPDLANPNETIADIDIVLKVQKPKNVWEFYIASELHRRLANSKDSQWFMSIPRCFVYNDGSIFVSERHPYSLLDVCNKVPQLDGQAVREVLAAYFGIELLIILEKLHQAKIIHGDIKPDNFLVQRIPTVNIQASSASDMFSSINPALILIDFGISVDMSLFPQGTEFTHAFEAKDIRTPEMIEGKKWSYQVDYFGVASILYTLLFGSYMKMNKNAEGLYMPQGQMKRWWSATVWNSFFKSFLNIESSSSLPDVVSTRKSFEELIFKKHRTTFNQVASTLSIGMRRK